MRELDKEVGELENRSERADEEEVDKTGKQEGQTTRRLKGLGIGE